MNHKQPLATYLRRGLLPVLAASILGVTLAGCGKKADETVIAPKPKPKPVEAPRPSVPSIEDLMAEMGIDDRIMFPESEAPGDEGSRRAILSLLDAFARSDAKSLEKLLSPVDRAELASLADSESFQQASDDLLDVEVQTGTSPLGQACVLAIFSVGSTFQPQLWYYEPGEEVTFEAAASPPDIMDRLAGDDWIKGWHDILTEEVELASALEEDVDPIRHVLADADDNSGSSATGTGPNPNPGGPGEGPKPPGRRKPPNAPRRAPGPG